MLLSNVYISSIVPDMRMIRFTLCFAALLLFAGVRADLAAPRDALLVTPAWVAAHLGDPDLVLLHVGTKDDYDAGHIPGARLATLDDVSVSDHEYKGNGLMLEMPAVAALRDALAGYGISDRSRIIVYVGKASVQSGTRVVFTLDYAGLGSRTSLLDGGMPAWTKDGHAITKDPTPVRMGTLSPLRINPIVVDAPFVKTHLQTPKFAVVDARAAAFYSGAQPGQSMQGPLRAGHIAGALSVPFTDVLNPQLQLKSAEELAALFTKAGVKSGDTVIAYCHIGQQATAVLLAARSLGYSVLLYDGSFEDWSVRADYPVDNPAKTGGRGGQRPPLSAR